MNASISKQTSHRRSARARRELRQPAAARLANGVINASTCLAELRGCAPGRNLAELASFLGGKPLGAPLGDQHTSEPAKPPRKPSHVHKPRPMAAAQPRPVFGRFGPVAMGAVQRLVQQFESGLQRPHPSMDVHKPDEAVDVAATQALLQTSPGGSSPIMPPNPFASMQPLQIMGDEDISHEATQLSSQASLEGADEDMPEA